MFVAASTRYSAIYSGFAILVLFMIWLYLSWLILLFGAAVAFYRQHPEYIVAESGEPRLSNRMRERLALAVMSLISQHYRDGRPAWTLLQLAQHLNVPGHAMRVVLGALHQAGVLAHTDSDPPGYLPARDLATLSVRTVLEVTRSAGEDRYLNPSALPVPEVVEQTLHRIEQALDAALGDMTVGALAADPVTQRIRTPPPLNLQARVRRPMSVIRSHRARTGTLPSRPSGNPDGPRPAGTDEPARSTIPGKFFQLLRSAPRRGEGAGPLAERGLEPAATRWRAPVHFHATLHRAREARAQRA